MPQSVCVHSLHQSAIHCNTLKHTATHCNTLQNTSTHCNTLQTPLINYRSHESWLMLHMIESRRIWVAYGCVMAHVNGTCHGSGSTILSSTIAATSHDSCDWVLIEMSHEYKSWITWIYIYIYMSQRKSPSGSKRRRKCNYHVWYRCSAGKHHVPATVEYLYQRSVADAHGDWAESGEQSWFADQQGPGWQQSRRLASTAISSITYVSSTTFRFLLRPQKECKLC